ncbi:hypothetical protein [Streptomyces olivochromogenes]|uniref:hypothetical protein n=1 Tax=Streptomyces olivochromogenes TaxID=1963 RepID=UPI001F16DCCA|nr:hypothetical protein [Streptomyces olivochromogenes]MCF3130831.1 hypothetical protein [Streptomyces olivochromogenes]
MSEGESHTGTGSAEEEDHARVALCPVTPEPAHGLVGIAELDLTGPGTAEQALGELGWRTLDDALEDPAYETAPDIPECDLISPLGHFTYLDGYVAMPFSYLYTIGGELLPDDYWGALPGWRSEPGAWRAEFDAHAESVVRLMTDRLGPAHYDIRRPKYAARYVTWAVGPNVLVITQRPEPISYHQFEHAEIVVCPRTVEGGHFPGGPALRELVTT